MGQTHSLLLRRLLFEGGPNPDAVEEHTAVKAQFVTPLKPTSPRDKGDTSRRSTISKPELG